MTCTNRTLEVDHVSHRREGPTRSTTELIGWCAQPNIVLPARHCGGDLNIPLIPSPVRVFVVEIFDKVHHR